ncbi:hypothetical protein IW261DRAFT_1567290 [Armillaria novae-zelandiae]|uniref:Uncharacterized protein n=1 Tax=Armillaria novae-zelandiae TaxID=153914 RepID=A0AA39P1X1_9AGAR|nr:hypothetical protein IW261DRAFT_1567290 [Armillaria novae-zelandiae]
MDDRYKWHLLKHQSYILQLNFFDYHFLFNIINTFHNNYLYHQRLHHLNNNHVKALESGLAEPYTSDDEETLAASSSPIKSTSEACHASPVGSKDAPRSCAHVHPIIFDPEEGPALKKPRRHEGLEPESVDREDEGFWELEGAGQIEDELADTEHKEDSGMDTSADEDQAEDEDIQNMDCADGAGAEVRVAHAHMEDAQDMDHAGGAGTWSESRLCPYPWECKQRGNKKQEKASHCPPVQTKNVKGPGRGKKGRPNWTDSPTLPPPMTSSLQLLARLSTVSLHQEFMQALNGITTQLMKPISDFLEWDDMSLGAIGQCCCMLKKSKGLGDYRLMLSYLQLMLTCTGREREAHWKGKKGPTVEECAHEAGTTKTKFQSWCSQGSRLIYLASAAMPFVLLLLAVTQMRVDICWSKSSSVEDISGLALALCCPESTGPSHKLVKDLILPHLQNLLHLAPDVPWFRLLFWDEVNHCWTQQHFSDIVHICHALDRAEVNFFFLPPPSELWTDLTPVPISDPIGSHQIAPVHTIRTGFHISINHCPFNTEEAPDWIAAERETVLNAVPVLSLAELEDQLDGFYNEKGEKSDPNSYILIDTDACEGQTLIIEDMDSHPVVVMIPNMADNIPHVQHSIVPQLQATWPGQFVPDHSECPDYWYYSWHGSCYNHYAE